MSYVEKVLQPGETVLARTRLHWFVYLAGWVYFITGLTLTIVAWTLAPTDTYVALAVAVVFGALTLAAWLHAWIRRVTTELAVTDHRVIYKTGILSRRTIEMNRSKIESVDVEQSMTGRLFGYGTIIVRGTGGSLEPFPNIADPLAFRTQITSA
jgi:uncharacterized membrane protein YdbT with pleckstrin-like domain